MNKTTQCPPDRYRFVHSTGYVSRALDPYSWMQDILKHRRDNSLPIPDNMQAIAEDQLCRTLPPGWCSYSDTGATPSDYIDIRVDLHDMLNATKVFGSFVLAGMPLVEPSVAEERGRICSACPANVGISGCSPCVGMAEAVAEVVGASKTSADALLENRSCAWCKCSSKAQIWVPIEILAKGVDDALLARNTFEHCWKRNGLLELRGLTTSPSE